MYVLFPVKTKMAFLSRRRIPLAILLYEQFIYLTLITLRPLKIKCNQALPLSFLGVGKPGASIVSSAFLTFDQSGEPMSHLGLQLTR